MADVVDLIVSFPTVIFTVPLMFCLCWFLLGLVVSGFDVGEGDLGADLDGDGSIDGFEHVAAALHLGALGLPLALLMLSFGGWSVSLLFSMLMRSAGAENTATIAGGFLVGLTAGVLFVWKVGGVLGQALATEQGPERSAAIGCVCKVRTLEVSETFGDAEIISGAMKNSLVKVRAPKGLFKRGDVALLVQHDLERDAYWIAEIEEEYRPHT